MKKTKILVPALAVLALGMAASVTGTVAWYAANIEVTGSGMQINCATSKNLVISDVDAATWAAAVSAKTTTKTTLNPVSTTDFDDNTKYFKVKDASKVDYNTGHVDNGGEFEAALSSAISEGNNAGFVRLDTFNVKLDAPNAQEIDLRLKSINVTRSNSGSEISKALRLGIKTTYTASVNTNAGTPTDIDDIYAPFGNASNVTYYAIKAAGTVDNQQADFSVVQYKEGATDLTQSTEANFSLPAANTTLVTGFAGGDILKIELFWWLEGTDSNCTSAKSVNVDDISVNIKFDYNAQP